MRKAMAMAKLRALRALILGLILFISFPLYAMKAIIWQPHETDLNVSNSQWQQLMHQVQHEGFDTLVLQWTRYGDSFLEEPSREQLAVKVRAAQQAGLKLILGLSMDPEFFTRQKQPAVALSNYVNCLLSLDLNQVTVWQQALDIEPDGWYISAEVDDVNWRELPQRELLLTWLKRTTEQIKQRSSRPVYISAFFTGQMAPTAFSSLLTAIQDQGVGVWVQDGGGVGVLSAAQRDVYLNELLACTADKKPAISGVIYELFTAQTQQTESFQAVPKSAAAITHLLTKRSVCNVAQLYFSLRYLPISAGVLEP